MTTCNNVESFAESRKNILIVEDEATLRDVLQFLLRMQGHQTFAAEDAEGALEILEREPLDLILSDVRMPGGGYRTLLERLETFTTPKPPLVLMSGALEVDGALIDESKTAGIVQKPFEWEELNRVLKKALEWVDPNILATSHS